MVGYLLALLCDGLRKLSSLPPLSFPAWRGGGGGSRAPSFPHTPVCAPSCTAAPAKRISAKKLPPPLPDEKEKSSPQVDSSKAASTEGLGLGKGRAEADWLLDPSPFPAPALFRLQPGRRERGFVRCAMEGRQRRAQPPQKPRLSSRQ